MTEREMIIFHSEYDVPGAISFGSSLWLGCTVPCASVLCTVMYLNTDFEHLSNNAEYLFKQKY